MTILVTGATGNIGRRIVDHLIDLGANDIRALTKNPAKAKLPDGVTAVTGYLGDPESLPAALDGVDRMYLAPLPETLDATLELVKRPAWSTSSRCRVRRIGRACRRHRRVRPRQHAARARRVSGELRHLVEQIKATRTVREPYPTAVEAPISMDDIARVAAALLVKPDESHFGRMYPLTGPEALTRAQIAEQIGVGIGVPSHATSSATGPRPKRRSKRPWARTRRGISTSRRRRRSSAGGQSPGRRSHRHTGRVGGAVGRAERRAVPLTQVLKYLASGWCSTNASVDCSG